jgi:hydroxymethylbilane synthase
MATRGSPLALRQTEIVRDALLTRYPDLTCSMVVIRTRGDIFLDRDVSILGGKGVFVDEIERALLDDEADLAVHSVKDLPAELPEGLDLVAFPAREDPRDALITADGRPLAALPAGARVGTSSLRRAAQLRALRPDLAIVGLRGNVGTRVARVDEGQIDGAILALAGLRRLGLDHRAAEVFDPQQFVPAPGQGALAIEARAGSAAARLAAVVDDGPARRAVTVERTFLAALGGSCHVPLGAFAHEVDGALVAHGLVAAARGTPCLRATVRGSPEAPEALGRALARALRAQGADAIIAEITASLTR